MAVVYLIPSPLEDDQVQSIPFYITQAVKACQVLFTENERTTRRFLKKLWKEQLPGEEIRIEDFEWFVIDKEAPSKFRQQLREKRTIGILSDAVCPGVAYPAQELVAIAQEMNVELRPLVGPASILLALMASGMNGQLFRFNGYLPIKEHEREKTIREIEADSKKKNYTQIFIETPYRNDALINSLLKTCNPSTRLCIAVNLTGKSESIRTKTIADWKKDIPAIHKQPAIFLMYAAS
jgi:16S rRNA (cytidine1402-2'-O)-methyltransferase